MKKQLVKIGTSLLFLLTILWLKTVRVRVLNQEYYAQAQLQHSPTIFSFWHGRLFPMMLLAPKNRDLYIAISRHGDGKLLSNIMERHGFKTIRGSTNRTSNSKKGAKDRGGSHILQESKRILADKNYLVITPDGPRGPRMRVKENMLHIAAETQSTIYPASFSAPWSIRFKNWDRFMLPLPFSLVYICFAKPIYVEKKKQKEASILLETRLNEISKKLDIISGKTPTEPDTNVA